MLSMRRPNPTLVIAFLAFAALLALLLAPRAAAAPPPNDNRADAVLLPTFPGAVHGTTAEATVERLDPQVSKCGRIESTVWYRVESAPDGTIVASTQAAAGFAPVVRIYRRGSSNIQELDCGTANAGGKVVVSVQAVRGAGFDPRRRPGTADGQFDLRAELFLPPANDERGGAVQLGRPPATVRATTLGATGDESDAAACGLAGGTVWYRLTEPASGRGSLSASGFDVLDLYHFDVERLSEVRLQLSQPVGRAFALILLTDSGVRVASGAGGFRRNLNRGRYVVAVEGTVGSRGGRYRLGLRLRDVTSASVLVFGSSSAEISPGDSVTLSCLVSPSAGGRVELQIDRFDPLTGWHFHRLLRTSAGAGVSWRQPAGGESAPDSSALRARARVAAATRTSSLPGRSDDHAAPRVSAP